MRAHASSRGRQVLHNLKWTAAKKTDERQHASIARGGERADASTMARLGASISADLARSRASAMARLGAAAAQRRDHLAPLRHRLAHHALGEQPARVETVDVHDLGRARGRVAVDGVAGAARQRLAVRGSGQRLECDASYLELAARVATRGLDAGHLASR